MVFYVESPEGNRYLSSYKLFIFIFKIKKLNDEEIKVLFTGMLCFITLEVLIFDTVNVSILKQVIGKLFALMCC